MKIQKQHLPDYFLTFADDYHQLLQLYTIEPSLSGRFLHTFAFVLNYPAVFAVDINDYQTALSQPDSFLSTRFMRDTMLQVAYMSDSFINLLPVLLELGGFDGEGVVLESFNQLIDANNELSLEVLSA